jgi:uroporphyrinogen decarboxylase
VSLRNLPVRAPRPDADAFVRHVLGTSRLPRVPLVEYIVDPVVLRPVVTDLLGRRWVEPGADRASWEPYLDNFIAFWYELGYDFVRLEIGLPFQHHGVVGDDPTMASGQRGWWDEHRGAIADWEEFERFPWPDPAAVDMWVLEYINDHLPEGMGLISCHGGGIYEHLSAILSYEGLALLLHDDRDLVRAVADKVGEGILAYYRRLLDIPRLVMVLQGDDMGFRSGTLVAPDDLREFALPWHKRFAEVAHASGRPYCLHSCGLVTAIMEDLIEDVGIDGKHSFEDAILPVTEFHAKYGTRIASLGGVDVDLLTRGSESQVRARVREIVEACHPRGRYALGSGNSIPSYVPVANYLAMLDEALEPV